MRKLTLVIGGYLALHSLAACKSRFFSFSPDPVADASATAKMMETPSGQIAIGQKSNDDSAGQKINLPAQKPAEYQPLQNASQKTIQLGKTTQFDVNGQRVDITFVSILEDSRCPKNVVCIWEGQARLQFTVSVPAMNLNKTVEPILRAGHPELGQINLGAIGIDLVGLNPDTATNVKSAQRSSPEATLVVGKAP